MLEHLSLFEATNNHNIDLKDSGTLEHARNLADQLILQCHEDSGRLIELENYVTVDTLRKDEFSAFTHLVIKLARSKTELMTIGSPFHIQIVIPVINENVRILKRDEHTNGEDFLREKVRQLQWLFANNVNGSYGILIVPDGMDTKTTEIAQQIINEEELADTVEVKHLKEIFNSSSQLVRRTMQSLDTPENSRKGGAVLGGMASTIEGIRKQGNINLENIFIAYSDSDLTVDIGQLGLFIKKLKTKQTNLVVASRRMPESFVIRTGKRLNNANTNVFVRELLLRDLLPPDTQCGLKVFNAESLLNFLNSTNDGDLIYDLIFDIQLITLFSIFQKSPVLSQGIVWTESEAESKTPKIEYYLGLLERFRTIFRELPSSMTNTNQLQSLFALNLLDYVFEPEEVKAKFTRWSELIDLLAQTFPSFNDPNFGKGPASLYTDQSIIEMGKILKSLKDKI